MRRNKEQTSQKHRSALFRVHKLEMEAQQSERLFSLSHRRKVESNNESKSLVNSMSTLDLLFLLMYFFMVFFT